MRNHLITAHDAEETDSQPAKKQLTISQSHDRGLERADDSGMRVALAYCFNPTQHFQNPPFCISIQVTLCMRGARGDLRGAHGLCVLN